MKFQFKSFTNQFIKVSRNNSDKAAIITNGKTILSYDELTTQAFILAESLKKHIANKLASDPKNCEIMVGIYLNKSAEYIVSILACWFSKCAFVPLDPELPKERLNHIIKETNLSIIITTKNIFSANEKFNNLEKIFPIFIDLNSKTNKSRNHSKTKEPTPKQQPEKLKARDLAYIIFTSGSTGLPKGVMIEHSGIVNLLNEQIKLFRLNNKSRSLFVLSTNFDASISDIGTSLLSGASLVIENNLTLSPSNSFYKLLEDRKITHIDIPPSFLKLLSPNKVPNTLKTLIIGGETCPVDVVKKWASKLHLVNVYGPTEATICTSMCLCEADSWSKPLIGKAIAHVQYKIVDDNLKEVSYGRSGELLISGPCLARSYLKRLELTKTKFIYIKNKRYYRTGDHVFLHKNGDIEFLGRIDRQIKLHGRLIEPEEIERLIKSHPLVKEVLVIKKIVHTKNPINSKEAEGQLVAFLSSKNTNLLATKKLSLIPELKKHLSKNLPEWMIPAHWEFLNELPHGSNGKIDIDKLNSYSLNKTAALQENFAYKTNISEKLSSSDNKKIEMIKKVLGHSNFGLNDNFFDLGCDSYTVLELALFAEEAGYTLSPTDVYRNPIIQDLISCFKNETSADSIQTKFLRQEAKFALNKIWESQISKQELENKYKNNKFPNNITPKNILITGVSGFLGSYLLIELLNKTKAQIYCLIRAENNKSAFAKLSESLVVHKYVLSKQDRARLICILGDITKNNLGVNKQDWLFLSNSIDTIYHCAAEVNNIYPYQKMKETNFKGTIEIAHLMLTGIPKQLHYASTLSVFVSSNQNTGILLESDKLSSSKVVYGGYAQSKWISEYFLRQLKKSIPNIFFYRFGLLVGDSKHGNSSKKDFFRSFIKGISKFGLIPSYSKSTEKIQVDITPIDYAASAMCHISLNLRKTLNHKVLKIDTFHIANTKSLNYKNLVGYLDKFIPNLKIVSPEKFMLSVKEKRKNQISPNELATVSSLSRILNKNNTSGFNYKGPMDLFQATKVSFDIRNTKKVLTNSKIICPKPSKKLLSKLILQALKS